MQLAQKILGDLDTMDTLPIDSHKASYVGIKRQTVL